MRRGLQWVRRRPVVGASIVAGALFAGMVLMRLRRGLWRGEELFWTLIPACGIGFLWYAFALSMRESGNAAKD